MGRKSTIDLMPPEVRDRLNELLRNPAYTQAQVTTWMNDFLAEIGEEPVMTERIVNRYAAKMDRIGAKLKQSRSIAEMWIGKLGSQPAGEVGLLLNEVVRNLAFESAMHLAEDEEPADPKLIRQLAMAIERLERAASENEKRAEEIEKRALAKAAERADTAAKRSGLTDTEWATIRAKFLGVEVTA